MTSDVRFGPAGLPIGYKGESNQVCSYIREKCLDAYEYQATYGVRISKQSALKLKENSENNDIRVSMHGPYYINLSSNKDDVVDRSIERLIQSARAAEWMGAYRIVFHPGFYTTYTPDEAMKKLNKAVDRLSEQLESLGIKDYTFAPETTGKKSQLGSLQEIIEICRRHEKFAPTIDFAHLHAREFGLFKDKNDYRKIFGLLEDELDIDILHCHYTHIEYTDKGERRHHVLGEDYGPPLDPLLSEIIDQGWNVTLICETPLRDRDATLMKGEYKTMINSKI
ncbi:MAG TPA: TIM barrel protein [Methanobacterium sp.]|jgi:deoxyribonuclease-4|nr:TIM barrel protein [Methanobacterium sp.]